MSRLVELDLYLDNPINFLIVVGQRIIMRLNRGIQNMFTK